MTAPEAVVTDNKSSFPSESNYIFKVVTSIGLHEGLVTKEMSDLDFEAMKHDGMTELVVCPLSTVTDFLSSKNFMILEQGILSHGVCKGDFNLTWLDFERTGDPTNSRVLPRFEDFISSYALMEFPLFGAIFTWLNYLSSSRLDRFFYSPEWNNKFWNVKEIAIAKYFSDQSRSTGLWLPYYGPSPFKFEPNVV
ncbi:hypothetical protein FRX31_014166 [Thalictrum thalictroides]|uniref:Uncharacterized protein n=1 Tax=Thalictrum thalictroides TaxID=46969 RepID=A0A7J6WH55_THATH|nr:hypothetical protein FRX31_014166 [Thalictrum thalictroides]